MLRNTALGPGLLWFLWNVHTKFLFVTLNGGDNLGEVDLDARIILKWKLGKYYMTVLAVFIRLKIARQILLTRLQLQITTHHSNDGPCSSVTEPARRAAVSMISQHVIT
jgi:hypothetical protein